MMPIRPQLVAMKGEPCTGKSTLANSISKQLGCLVIDQDDIRDSFLSLTKSPPTAKPDFVDDQSYEAACGLALALLQSGLNVVVDTPLARRSQLDQLLGLIASVPGSRLVVVECKPDRFTWRQWLEQRETRNDSTSFPWYKQSSWYDLEDQFKKGGNSSGYNTNDVPKLVIDTAEMFRIGDITFALWRLVESERPHHINNFLDWMDKHAKGLIEDEGVEERSEAKVFKPEDDPENHYFHYHDLRKQSSVRTNDEIVKCRGCFGFINNGPAYVCKYCEISLHVTCAELPTRKEIKPQDYPIFLREITNMEIMNTYSFPETIRCDYCQSHNGGGGFHDCFECLFESFVKSAELPSILHHPCHKHPLCIMIVPLKFGCEYLCKACGDQGRNVMYHCYECGFDCHVTCGLLPRAYKQMRHLHILDIAYLSHEAESGKEFICDACETYRNPKHWIYYCEPCEFASHLSCMTFDS